MCAFLFFTSQSFSKEKTVNKRIESGKTLLQQKFEVNKICNNYQSLPVIKKIPLSDLEYGYHGLAFDGKFLYSISFLNSSPKKIKKLSPDTGEIIEEYEWTQSCCPSSIAWNGPHFYVHDCEHSTLYSVDTQFKIIQKFPNQYWARDITFDGVYLISIASYEKVIFSWIDLQNGSIVKEIDYPELGIIDISSVAWDGNYLWISTYNHQADLVKVDTKGNIIEKFKSRPEHFINGLEFDGQFLWSIYCNSEEDHSCSLYKLDIGHTPSLKIKDTDADGVIDQWDSCPKTPINSCVNNKGCSCELLIIDEKGKVEKNKWKTYYSNIENQYSQFNVNIQNLTDDVDLYVKKGSKPDFNTYDCRPYKGGKRDELCNLNNSSNSLWYFCVYGYKAADFTISVKAKR